MRALTAIFATLVCTTTAFAQDRPNTILVMDGSGSMWGQIDGVAKITIAQDVVGDLLQTFPDDQGLGLTVYGHRERGNCTDIETVVAPAPGTRDAIINAVNGIKPLGKTPMTDAIIAAAEALRYTEDSATVILVSDGVETCNPDPCAAARLLEEAGIDFTAHVIGFDVGSDADALAQMQCIAEETGGDFLTADNATELTDALTAVVVEPEPAEIALTLEARLETQSGPLIDDPIFWVFGDAQDGDTANPFETDILEGTYEITAYRLIDELEITRDIVINQATQTEVFVFPQALPTVTLTAPDTAPAGSSVPVSWDAPLAQYDAVMIVTPDTVVRRSVSDNYISTNNQTRGDIIAPGVPGDYLLRYVSADDDLLAEQPITITEAQVIITAPDTAPAGALIPVSWENGPAQPYDQVRITAVGAPTSRNGIYLRANDDFTSGTMALPSVPGDYVLRYVMAEDEAVMGERPITITPSIVTIMAPDTAAAASTITVTWENGPGGAYDKVILSPVGADVNPRDPYILARGDTASGQIVLPVETGDYVLRYVSDADDGFLAERPITLTEDEAGLQFPAQTPIGSTITVAWDGPDNKDDYIAVGEAGGRWINYTRTNTGNPLQLLMPTEPGDYEVRYHLNEGGTIITAAPITVTDLKGAITAPDTATAGESITVGWDGPDYRDDYISVGLPGGRYINYTRTRAGNPLQLIMPTEPGDYQIRYQLHQDAKIIATHDITLTDVAAQLNFDAEATAGSTLTVAWDGPDYDNDYISVGLPGERYINYTRTRAGNPLNLLLPTEAGDYEVRYQLHQGGDIIASAPLKIVDVAAQVTAPQTAMAGSTVAVGWDGPDYDNDYIAVGPVGERYINYTRTNAGNPAQLLLPTEAGDYEIRYHLHQGGDVLASQIITLEPVKAEVTAPATANIGEPVTVMWDGPDYPRDYIAVSEVGENGYVNYVRTNEGNPAVIPMPPTAGDYEIRYVLQQGGKVVARSPVTVEAIKAQLVAPPSGVADTTIPVGWDGPDYSRDYVAIYPVGGNRYTSYTRTSAGNPLMLELPEAPGDYEIRYMMHQGAVVLANVPFTVTAE